jgi:hypothetical protein
MRRRTRPAKARGYLARTAEAAYFHPRAPIAQLVEHLICNQRVGSSSLSGGTTLVSDAGELAKAALLESLSVQLQDRVPSLFEPSPQDVRSALGALSQGKNFALLARDFFARLTYRSLDYYLSRELAVHTGQEMRFATDSDRVAFQNDLAQHTFEASRIVEEFAAGWYGKTVWQKQQLDQEAINKFTAYAFKKLRGELGRRRANI